MIQRAFFLPYEPHELRGDILAMCSGRSGALAKIY